MDRCLRTPRLLLRRWCDSDLAPFAALNADPEVMRWLLGPLPRELSDRMVERIETHFERHDFGLWAVERVADARLLGMVGLQHVNFEAPFTPAIEIGWRLCREAWGSGYCTEAATLALNDAFARMAIEEVVSFTIPENLRSQAVMSRLGLTRDRQGDFDHPRLPVSHPMRPHWLFRLRRSAWQAHAPTMAALSPGAPTAAHCSIDPKQVDRKQINQIQIDQNQEDL